MPRARDIDPHDMRTYDPEVRDLIENAKASYRVYTEQEKLWRSRFYYLLEGGYRLRQRFDPNAKLPWDLEENKHVDPELFEPWIIGQPSVDVLDATRESDGQIVFIKTVKKGSTELDIAKFLRCLEIRDEKNHCVPILDIIGLPESNATKKNVVPPYPEEAYIVMPFLRAINDPPFEIVHDIVELVDQLLEGLVFMHANGIAHRDCAFRNVMMDASSIFPQGFHPVARLQDPTGFKPAIQLPRASGAVKYYFVDFGISTKVDPGQTTTVVGRDGLDQEVPELNDNIAYDPFKVDIFIVGNLFKTFLYKNYSNVSFLYPLIDAMTQQEPSRRPVAAEAERLWKEIRRSISPLQTAFRLKPQGELWLQAVVLDTWHVGKTVFSWLTDVQG